MGDSYEGTLKNNYLYNGKELFDDADLNWYDYGFRNYDPQIGRFPQLDPLTHSYPFLTPYQYASCEPIANVYMDGLEAKEVVTGIGKAFSDIPTGAMAIEKGLVEAVVKAFPAAKAITKGVQLSIGSIINTARVAINIVNTPTVTRNVPLTQLDNDRKVLFNMGAKCHISNEEVAIKEEISWYHKTKNLDKVQGQVLPPRSKAAEFFFGHRTVENPDYRSSITLGEKPPKGWFSPTLDVGADGYIIGPTPMKPLGGTIPIGGIRSFPGSKVVSGFKGHAVNQAITRGFKTPDILKIIREGNVVEGMGRYGPQLKFTLGSNTVVVNAQGKVVTMFSSATGTANGLGRGFFIPFK